MCWCGVVCLFGCLTHTQEYSKTPVVAYGHYNSLDGDPNPEKQKKRCVSLLCLLCVCVCVCVRWALT